LENAGLNLETRHAEKKHVFFYFQSSIFSIDSQYSVICVCLA